MNTTTKKEDPILANIKADNRQAFADLKSGKIEINLSPDLVRTLQTLHARGVLSDMYAPAVHISALVHALATRRERDTRQWGAVCHQCHHEKPLCVCNSQEAA